MKLPYSLSAAVITGLLMPAGATLISYWKFDETEGDVAAATFGKDAAWQNPGNNLFWDPNGISGGAADLGGQNSGNNYFNADLNGLLNSDAMTVAFWVNPDGITGGNYDGIFMTRGNNPGPRYPDSQPAGNGNWGVAYNANGDSTSLDARAFGAIDSPPGSFVGDDADAGSDANGWYHVAWVWDGVIGTQTLYLNGVESISGTGEIATLIGGIWHIGNDAANGSRDFDGRIDDMAVWDTPLTAEQIAGLAALTTSPGDIDAPVDQDGDGMPDVYEDQFPGILDKTVNDADDDNDLVDGTPTPDGLSNFREFELGTDPSNPDSDKDGIFDGEEIVAGEDSFITLPLNNDTDGDDLLDGEETSDSNGFVTDPTKIDSDGDTFSDKVEIDGGTDPLDSTDPPVAGLPTNGLVALYKFDEAEGDSALDSAIADGSQDAVTTQGLPAWTADGLIGGALVLDGSTSLTAPDALQSGMEGDASSFSISGWVKAAAEGQYKGVYTTRDTSQEPNLNWGLNVRNAPAIGEIRFANSGVTSLGVPTEPIGLDQWVHLAMTYTTDGFEAVGKTYFNGALVGTRTTTEHNVKGFYDSVGEFFIGDDPCCGGREFNGMIDEIAVWNVQLSDADVSSVYRNGIAGKGLSAQGADALVIREVRVDETGDVILSWNSNPAEGTSYTLLINDDLSVPLEQWSDVDDGIKTEGESTTFIVNSGNFPQGATKFFFVIVEN